MTRSMFYIKSLIFFIIAACFVFFADDKQSMMWHANWTIITIMAYAMWHDWNIFPDFIRLYVVRKLSRTVANPAITAPPSGGQVNLVVGRDPLTKE